MGSETMARAMVTRCSCPPESCRGKWFMRSAEADDGESGLHMRAALRLGEVGEQQRQLHILKRGEHGDEVIHLEDEPNVASAPFA